MSRHYELVSVSLGTWVSRHNSPQDAEDDALVDEIQQRLHDAVRAIVEDPRYNRVLGTRY